MIGNAVLKGLYYKEMYRNSLKLIDNLTKENKLYEQIVLHLQQQVEKQPEQIIKTNWTLIAIGSAVSILISSALFIGVNNATR